MRCFKFSWVDMRCFYFQILLWKFWRWNLSLWMIQHLKTKVWTATTFCLFQWDDDYDGPPYGRLLSSFMLSDLYLGHLVMETLKRPCSKWITHLIDLLMFFFSALWNVTTFMSMFRVKMHTLDNCDRSSWIPIPTDHILHSMRYQHVLPMMVVM